MSKEEEVNVAVLEYLNVQNRPYSAIDVFNNLHNAFKKGAVVKALETLAEQGRIKEKVYGKQKAYVADQDQFPVIPPSELQEIDSEIKVLSNKLKTTSESTRQLEGELRSFSSALSTEEAAQQLAAIKNECSVCVKRLEAIKSNGNVVSPEERKEIVEARTKYVKEWRKRKRIANDILNAILEGYPKTKTQLIEEIGMETDEEYKVSPPVL